MRLVISISWLELTYVHPFSLDVLYLGYSMVNPTPNLPRLDLCLNNDKVQWPFLYHHASAPLILPYASRAQSTLSTQVRTK